MNRHHFAVFIRNCRLILLLRRDFSEGDLNIFRPAEWRWKITQVSRGAAGELNPDKSIIGASREDSFACLTLFFKSGLESCKKNGGEPGGGGGEGGYSGSPGDRKFFL